jgi:ParB/RepB/Spo0J family partition protein
MRDAQGSRGTWRLAQRRDYRSSNGSGTMPIMRMPWSKSGNLQLDLLDAHAASEALPAPSAVRGAPARSPSMVSTANLYEDANNPRTEIPDAELDELADDIRQHGILQPIVVHRADREGRHQIHFGAKRWRAAQRIGLLEVPVVVRDGPTNPYAQVAENQKRHGLTPLDLARFIRSRIEAGDSNTTVARTLGLDLTTVAHHLALLDLPPVVDAAMKAGRCSSPRTLYELENCMQRSRSASPNWWLAPTRSHAKRWPRSGTPLRRRLRLQAQKSRGQHGPARRLSCCLAPPGSARSWTLL